MPGSAAATHVIEICEGLRRRGFAVTLVAEHGASRGGFAAQIARYARITALALRRIRSAEVVYMRSHFAAYGVAAAARLLRRTTIQEINGIYAEAFVTHPRFARLQGSLSLLQRQQYRWADALIAVTPELVSWGAEQAGHPRAFHVGNGANTALFRPDGPKAVRDRSYAVFFGGLTRWHGVETMLQAVQSPAWPDGTDLVLAGPVVDRSLDPLIAAVPPNVVRLERVPQENLPSLVRGAVAALVPTLDPRGIAAYGITPLKLFEMMACGAAVVASDYPGMGDLVRDGPAGLVVPPGDPDALAQAVATLAGDPALRATLGQAGARLVAEKHSWDARAGETAQVIERVFGKSR